MMKMTLNSATDGPESWENLQTLLASLAEGFVILDSSLTIVACSDSWAQIFGQTKEALAGKSLPDVSSAIEATGCMDIVMNVRKTGESLLIEDFVLPREAGDVHLVLRAFKIGDGVGFTTIDITKQRQIEEDLRHANREVNRLMASISDSLWTAELSENGKLDCRYYSPVVERITGRPPIFYMEGPHRWLSIIHPDDLPRVEDVLDRALFDDVDRVVEEYRITLPDGAVRWVRDSILVTGGEDSPRRLSGVLTDVTESRKAWTALEAERASLADRVAERTEELWEANAELARAARMKDEFLVNMSHELRTPLNTILGMSEALQEEVYGGLTEKQRESLSLIEEGGRHLLSLINDILDVSKIEAGKVELEIGAASIGSVCQSSLWLIKQIAHKQGLKVVSNVDNSLTEIRVDARRLKQILLNLLSNAVKFTPEGGEMGLDAKIDVDGWAVRFVVWDKGIGIPSETMGGLFTPFVQLDSSLSRKYEGTGLGLALAHRLTALHGGSVKLESEDGKGCRFTVSLPWEPPGRDKGEGGPCSGLVTTLIGENGSEVARAQLEGIGCRVVMAEDLGETSLSGEGKRPDVIVMDIKMAGPDELDMVQRVRSADFGISNLPLVVLTSLDLPGARQSFIDVGATEYMTKPIDPRVLIEIVESRRNRD